MRRLLGGVISWFKSVWETGLDAYRVLEAFDFLWLVGTYMTTKVMTDMVIASQFAWYGSFPPVWLPTGAPKGIFLLIPGYSNSYKQMVMLAHHLHESDYIVVTAWTPRQGNILRYADAIEQNEPVFEELNRLAAQYHVPVWFLGFSYGGCCAIRFATHFKNVYGKLVTHLVLVQSPVRGSRIAKYGSYPAALEQIPGSTPVLTTIRQLEELEAAGVTIKYYCALYDPVVRRRDSRLPRDGHAQIRWSEPLPHIGHWGALQNPWAVDSMVGFIHHMNGGSGGESC